MSHLFRTAMAWFTHLDRQEWFIVLIVGTLLGCLCMRGYGSRSNY
jgi:hypothetical protein